MAYVRSDGFRDYLVARQADVAQVLERAKTAGDEQTLETIRAILETEPVPLNEIGADD